MDKEFKQKLIGMLTDIGRRLDVHSELINKELENIKKNQSEKKNTTLEMKNSLEGLNSRVEDKEEWISKLDKRLEEMTQAEKKKEKRIKQNENSLRELYDNIKHTNIHIIGVPDGEERDIKGQRINLKKYQLKTFLT